MIPRSSRFADTLRVALVFWLVSTLVGIAFNLDLSSPSPSFLTERDSIVLGLVEGFTELLPISSTGHLIVTRHVLKLPSTPRIGDDEDPLDTFIVLIQTGACVAILVAYRRRWWGIVRGVCGQNREGLRLFSRLVVALVPVVLLGLFTESWITRNLFSVKIVAGGAAVGAFIMLGLHLNQRGVDGERNRALESLRFRDALLVGLLQCLALWPGMSRSMTTIAGGYMVGLGANAAAEFSFLLGVPTLAGAALLKGIKHGGPMIQALGWLPAMTGVVVAAVAAACSIRALLTILNRYGLAPFAIYRLALAAVLMLLPAF